MANSGKATPVRGRVSPKKTGRALTVLQSDQVVKAVTSYLKPFCKDRNLSEAEIEEEARTLLGFIHIAIDDPGVLDPAYRNLHLEAATRASRRAREVAQILIDEIGSNSPESIDETAKRAVATIRRLRTRCDRDKTQKSGRRSTRR